MVSAAPLNHIDSIDLCSIVGNILENAITACLDIPKKQRFIRMVISEEQNKELYIAISNSFSGKLRKKETTTSPPTRAEMASSLSP